MDDSDVDESSTSPRTIVQPAASLSLLSRSVTTDRTARRAVTALAGLRDAWGNEAWMPSDRFLVLADGSKAPPRKMTHAHLFYLWSITKNAQSRGMDLKSVWAPGGVLYDVMDQAAAGGPLRWDPDSTAKDAWALFKSRHGAVSEAVSVASNAAPAIGDDDPLPDSDDDHQPDFEDAVELGRGTETIPPVDVGDELGSPSEIFNSPAIRDDSDFQMDSNITGARDIHDFRMTLTGGLSLASPVTSALSGKLNDHTLSLLCAKAREEAEPSTFIADPLWLELAEGLPATIPTGAQQQIILAPLHHREASGHWTLLRLDMRHGLIEHYDPGELAGLSEKVIDAIKAWHCRVASSSRQPASAVMRGPRQTDPVSCGVYVMGALFHLLDKETLADMPSSVSDLRTLLQAKLEHQATTKSGLLKRRRLESPDMSWTLRDKSPEMPSTCGKFPHIPAPPGTELASHNAQDIGLEFLSKMRTRFAGQKFESVATVQQRLSSQQQELAKALSSLKTAEEAVRNATATETATMNRLEAAQKNMDALHQWSAPWMGSFVDAPVPQYFAPEGIDAVNPFAIMRAATIAGRDQIESEHKAAAAAVQSSNLACDQAKMDLQRATDIHQHLLIALSNDEETLVIAQILEDLCKITHDK